MKLERKKVKELMKEIAVEDMIEGMEKLYKENEELKARLELLEPPEDKEVLDYIG